MTEPIKVSLDAWIIQDGNYGDFARGQRRSFALEFWTAKPLVVRHQDASDGPEASWLRDVTYTVKGAVAFVAPEWWVLDVGIPMYQLGIAPAQVGARVRGEVSVGIDHFSYFERLALEPGAPPLIHDWNIQSIELDTTPRIEVRPRYFERDVNRQSSKTIPKTKAWSDDQGWAGYVLTCVLLSDAPRIRL